MKYFQVYKTYKITKTLILFLLIFSPFTAFSETKPLGYKNIIEVEGPDLHEIKIPLQNITRITCSSGKISSPIFSSEKVLQVSKGNNNDYFLKISVITVDSESGIRQSYDDRPRDVFISCSDDVFSLKLVPNEKLNSRTIILKPSKDYTQKEKSFEDGYEEKIVDLIKSAYFELVPKGYKVQKTPNNLLNSQDFEEIKLNSFNNNHHKVIGDFYLTKRLSYIGQEFIVEDWIIHYNTSFFYDESSNVYLSEKYFYKYFKDYRAISLSVQKLNKYVPKGRLIAIRKNIDGKF